MLKIVLVLSLCLFASCKARVYNENFFQDAAHPGKCVTGDKVVAPGQSIKHPVLECAQFTCDNAQGLATIETCDPVSALASPIATMKVNDPSNTPTCTWGDFIDTTAPFPECCKRHFSCVL